MRFKFQLEIDLKWFEQLLRKERVCWERKTSYYNKTIYFINLFHIRVYHHTIPFLCFFFSVQSLLRFFG